jgi:hypothetical protein
MTKMVKALSAPIDVGGVPWSYGGSAPSPSYGLVRSNSINPATTANMRVALPSLRTDPNEYVSGATIQWYGGRGANLANFSQQMWLKAGAFGSTTGFQANLSGVTSAVTYYSNSLPTVTSGVDDTVRRTKDFFVEWIETNTSGAGSSLGWTLYRFEVVFEISFLNALRG